MRNRGEGERDVRFRGVAKEGSERKKSERKREIAKERSERKGYREITEKETYTGRERDIHRERRRRQREGT
eukprot:693941-Amorphochlora_amoeboformis.AAC.1